MRSQKGEFKYIDDGVDLRYQLASYYSYFTEQADSVTPVVTVPYIDYSQLGM